MGGLRLEGFGDGLRLEGFGDGLRLEGFGVAGGLRLEGSGVAAGFLVEGLGVSAGFGLESFRLRRLDFGLEGLGLEGSGSGFGVSVGPGLFEVLGRFGSGLGSFWVSGISFWVDMSWVSGANGG